MKVTVHARAHRTLRHLSNYRSAADALPDYARAIPLKLDEELVGVYENEASQPSGFAVTTHGLRLPTTWRLLAFDAMDEICEPEEKGLKEPAVTIITVSGEKVQISVLGGEGKFEDVYQVLRFLIRVREDITRDSRYLA